MNKLPISLVVITLNEEKNLTRCLQSAPFVNDIVILDSGSTDSTIAIAKQFGARVYQQKWLGFGPQKAKATEFAINDWVLSLDADEALSPELQDEIIRVFQNGISGEVDAYQMPRRNWYCGRWMRYAGMYPDHQTRFFHKGKAHWAMVPVHERVMAQTVRSFRSPLLHWSFADVSHQIATINKYSSLRAQEWRSKNKNVSGFRMWLKTVGKFIELYVVKRGFLDGTQGLMVSLSGAFATYLRWAKLFEIYYYEKSQKNAKETRLDLR